MDDVTRILGEIEKGDTGAAGRLLPLVYDELRRLAAQKLAREKPGHTLQATALVHEAYLRLVGGESRGVATPEDRRDKPGGSPRNRAYFFAAAAEAMRRILVEAARRRRSQKRGGGREREELAEDRIAAPEPREDLVALDNALTRFAVVDAQAARLVELRYFAGLSIPDAAEALGVAPRTADRLWAYARAWLHREVGGENSEK